MKWNRLWKEKEMRVMKSHFGLNHKKAKHVSTTQLLSSAWGKKARLESTYQSIIGSRLSDRGRGDKFQVGVVPFSWEQQSGEAIRRQYLAVEEMADWLSESESVAQSCSTLCNPMNYSPLGLSVLGTVQARIQEWVATPFSRGSSQPRDQTQISCTVGRFFTIWTTREAQ